MHPLSEKPMAYPETNNIDNQELHKFESQAMRWWDPNGTFKTLHEINPLRVGYIDEQASLDGKQVLDVGCGGGLLSEAMAKKGASVVGVDAGKNAIEVARLHLHESRLTIDYRVTQVEKLLPEEQDQYDVVTCLEMLEHVPDPEAIVAACAKLVRVGGSLFFSTLNRNFRSFLGAIVAAEYLLKLLPRGTHSYSNFIKPSELARTARKYGLHLHHCTGLGYNPLLKTYHLTPNTRINYMMHFTRIV